MVFSDAMRALEIDAEKYVAKSRKYIRMNTKQELYLKSKSFIEIQDRKLQNNFFLPSSLNNLV